MVFPSIRCSKFMTIVDIFHVQCKEFVFAYGPIVLNSLHKIVALDLCYTTGICSDPKNETSQNVNLKNDGNVEPNYQNQARKIFLPREYALRSKWQPTLRYLLMSTPTFSCSH